MTKIIAIVFLHKVDGLFIATYCSKKFKKHLEWSLLRSPSEWRGVTCENGKITKIVLNHYIRRVVSCPKHKAFLDDDFFRSYARSEVLKHGYLTKKKHLKGLIFPTTLQVLDLSDNQFGSECIKVLKLPRRLQKLNLSNCNIQDDDLKSLVLPQTLITLDLSNNNIGNEGIMNLVLPPGLKILKLRNCNITDEGLKGIKLQEIIRM